MPSVVWLSIKAEEELNNVIWQKIAYFWEICPARYYHTINCTLTKFWFYRYFYKAIENMQNKFLMEYTKCHSQWLTWRRANNWEGWDHNTMNGLITLNSQCNGFTKQHLVTDTNNFIPQVDVHLGLCINNSNSQYQNETLFITITS